MEDKIKDYLIKNNFFVDRDSLTVTELIDGNSSNHLNFKASSPELSLLVRLTKPNNIASYTNLADEFTILKLIEDTKVAPKVISIDLEKFDTPILIEEFLTGNDVHYCKPSTEIATAVVDLIYQVSQIPLREDQFPFKYTYTTYRTDFRTWDQRLQEIINEAPELSDNVAKLKTLSEQAKEKLLSIDTLLADAPTEFIYNDIRPSNVFWYEDSKQAVFIDWQKVSLGDPSFMFALFIRRFAHLWDNDTNFTKSLITRYNRKDIKNFDTLLNTRIFERAVSDAIWSTWALVKQNKTSEAANILDNEYYQEAQTLL